MKTTKVLAVLLLVASIVACAKIPISGRRAVKLLPESQMIGMSITQYDDFMNQSQVVADSDPRTQMVKRLGSNIQKACEKYLAENGQSKWIEGFVWEYNLVDDPTVNAWCMPGGKVVVYTGILDVAQDEAGLAVVMGHEIAHAVARHGNERMSQQLAIQAGGVALAVMMSDRPAETQEMFANAYGMGTGLGALKFSREHESEADHMGLIFSSMAGYDPREAPEFWERMSAGGGQQPPEFLSTHPSHETRVSDLNALMDEALVYYNASNKQ
jgi:predicted Zn-dependent protease